MNLESACSWLAHGTGKRGLAHGPERSSVIREESRRAGCLSPFPACPAQSRAAPAVLPPASAGPAGRSEVTDPGHNPKARHREPRHPSAPTQGHIHGPDQALAQPLLTDRLHVAPAIEEGVDDGRIPLLTSPLAEDLVDLHQAEPLAIRPVA